MRLGVCTAYASRDVARVGALNLRLFSKISFRSLDNSRADGFFRFQGRNFRARFRDR